MLIPLFCGMTQRPNVSWHVAEQIGLLLFKMSTFCPYACSNMLTPLINALLLCQWCYGPCYAKRAVNAVSGRQCHESVTDRIDAERRLVDPSLVFDRIEVRLFSWPHGLLGPILFIMYTVELVGLILRYTADMPARTRLRSSSTIFLMFAHLAALLLVTAHLLQLVPGSGTLSLVMLLLQHRFCHFVENWRHT